MFEGRFWLKDKAARYDGKPQRLGWLVSDSRGEDTRRTAAFVIVFGILYLLKSLSGFSSSRAKTSFYLHKVNDCSETKTNGGR
jgi:hypothetical protein